VTTQELTQDLVVPLDDIERSRSSASWSVAQNGWKQLLPDLPDDVIAMLATPVVVTAESLAPRVPAVVPVPAPAECAPTFLAPAPPRRVSRQRRFARG
jgi:nitrogen fixation protein